MGIYIPVLYNGQPSPLVGRGSLFPTQKGDMFCVRRGKGENVLFIHSLGITPCSYEFRDSFRALGSIARVWALDLPGYGRSERREAPYTSVDYILAIKDFIVKRIHAPTVLVASGICASYALFAAYALPVFVKGVVSSGGYSSVKEVEYYASKKGLSPQSIASLFEDEAQIKSCLTDTASCDLNGERLQALVDEASFSVKYSQYGAWAPASFFNGACDISLLHIVRDITCPLISIEGKRTFTLPLTRVKRICADTASQLPHISQPELLTEAVRELLGEEGA